MKTALGQTRPSWSRPKVDALLLMADFVVKVGFEAVLSVGAGFEYRGMPIVAAGLLAGAGVDALKPTLATQFDATNRTRRLDGCDWRGASHKLGEPPQVLRDGCRLLDKTLSLISRCSSYSDWGRPQPSAVP